MEKEFIANVIYFGHEINTFVVLVNEKQVRVKAVAKINDFLKYKTLNPINKLFRLIYFLHLQEKYGIRKKILLRVFQLLKPLSSGIFKKYYFYLKTIVENDIKIIDGKNVAILQNFVDEHHIDIFVVNSWGILPREIVDMPKMGCVNIHPSRLPKYKGSLPTLWALKNGDKNSAVTYMVLDHSVDGGQIIAKHEFSIVPTDTGISIDKKIDEIVALTLSNDIVSYLKGQTILQPQSHKEATKTGKFHAYKAIDFNGERAVDIFNKINLYTYQYPTNRCYATLMERRITFIGCNGVVELQSLKPGSFKINGFNLFIGCKDQAIKLILFKDVNLVNSCLFYLKVIQF